MSLMDRIRDAIDAKRRWARIATRSDSMESELVEALEGARRERDSKLERLRGLREDERRKDKRESLKDEIASLEAIIDTLLDRLDRRDRKGYRAKQNLREAEERLSKLREIRRRRAAQVDSGEGPWAGTQSIVENEVLPVFERNGVPVSSLKRAANHPLSISNPSSDHNEANTSAYAADGATFNGAPVAHEVARALGISGYSTGNYTGYTITRSGNSFRVQILWAVSGHFDHVHVGIRRL